MASTEQRRKFEAFRALWGNEAGHSRGNPTSSITSGPKSGGLASSDRLSTSGAPHLHGSSSYRFGPSLGEASNKSKPAPPSIGNSNQSAKYSSNDDRHPKANTPSTVFKLHIIDLEDSSPNHGSSTTHADSSCRTPLNSTSTEDLEQYDDEKLLRIELKLQQELGIQGSIQPPVVEGNNTTPRTSNLSDDGGISSQASSSAKHNGQSDEDKKSRIQPQTLMDRNMGAGGRVRGREVSTENDSTLQEASRTPIISQDRESQTTAIALTSNTDVLNGRQTRAFKPTKVDDESERDLIALQLSTTKKFEEKPIAEEKQKALDALERKRENQERGSEPKTFTETPRPWKSSVTNGAKKSLFQTYVTPGEPSRTVAELSHANDQYENLPRLEIFCNEEYEENTGNPLLGDSSLPSRIIRSAENQEAKVVGRWSDVRGDAEEAPAPAVALDVAEAHLTRSLQAEGQQKRQAQLLSYDDEADLRATKKRKSKIYTLEDSRVLDINVTSSQKSTTSFQSKISYGSQADANRVSTAPSHSIPPSFEDASSEDRMLFSMRENGIDMKTVIAAMKKATGRTYQMKTLYSRYHRMKANSWSQTRVHVSHHTKKILPPYPGNSYTQDEKTMSVDTDQHVPLIGLPALVAKYPNPTNSDSKNRKPRKKRDREKEKARARGKSRIKSEQRERERQAANNRSFGNVAGEDEVIYFEPTGETSQNHVNADDKRQKRLDVEKAKRKAKLDKHEKEVRAALRRFHPEQGKNNLFMEQGYEEAAPRAVSEYESSSSSDEDEDDQPQSVRYPPGLLPTSDHTTTAIKTVSEATLAKLRQEDVEVPQQRDEDVEELQSENERDPETSYSYYVARRISHIKYNENCSAGPWEASQSELGPFYTLAEANKMAEINVRPATMEGPLYSNGLKSISCNFGEDGLQAWTTTGERGKIETFVVRETSTDPSPSNIAFSVPRYLYLLNENSIITSTSPGDNEPQRYLKQQPVEVFTTLDLANKEAACRWFEHATKHLDVKKPLEDIKKVELGVDLRKEVRMMNEDRVGFERGWEENGGEGRVWVEVRMVRGPRN